MILRVAVLDLFWFGVALVLCGLSRTRRLRILSALVALYVLVELFAHRLMEDAAARFF